jgi:hypothetical protein
MRVAARGELHAEVIRQDRVVLHELGKWGLIGPPEPDLHPSLERHGRRDRVRIRFLREKKRALASATDGTTIRVRIVSRNSLAIPWFIRRLSQSAVT